ncbi:MAG TPA: dihydroorotate dehydrogenase electron transfer subunit [Ornithinicoccus sp.]|jgi:dihydroorotate dehydrogenase electron transfer subunit|nr:dihydroorotate dehydrogenase electron transfer subunit [Ornithinicoccus sp.]
MTAPGCVPVTAEIVAVRQDGAARVLTLAVPAAVAAPRPGQFLQVPPRAGQADVLPRTWWLSGGRSDPAHGTTLEAVVPGTGAWYPGDELTVRGPLGRGFPLPSEPVDAVVVGHEPGQAPARWLAALLRDRGCPTTLVLSARDADHHLDLVPARRVADRVLLSTPDDLPPLLRGPVAGTSFDLLYAVGPRPVVDTGVAVAAEVGAASQVTAFDAGDGRWCGVGLCGACATVAATATGRRHVLPCAVGPVLPGDRLVAGGPR